MINKIKNWLSLKLFYFCISKYNFFYKKNIKLNYDLNILKKILQNKKIALVGNARENLFKKNNIDSFDIVIRINLPPHKKYHNTIGKRCDILFLQGSGGTHHMLNNNFIKVWLDHKTAIYSHYGIGEIYNYPYKWEKELTNIIKANPTAGARSFHLLNKLLIYPNITLFGFSHKLTNWYKLNLNNLHHKPHLEKKFFKNVMNKNPKIKYSI